MGRRLAKFILDTNILIPVEDPRQTPPTYAALLRELQAQGHTVYVHEATLADIGRDPHDQRRTLSLSKIGKYPRVRMSWRDRAALTREFGEIRHDNDLCDCHILASVKDGAVDFLITEDSGLHTRARRHGLDGRVLYVRQALDQVTGAYAQLDYSLRSISRKYCYELNASDPIFESLAHDYAPFREWWSSKCVANHRECWVVSDAEKIAALCVFKEETAGEAPPGVSGPRTLKLCTFKVSEEYRGGRLGEQMLRQALCFAFDGGFDSAYLTAYPKQQSLRELILFYGFKRVGAEPSGEIVYAKSWDRGAFLDAHEYARARRSYPLFPSTFPGAVIVPVRPGYHDRLFPESAARLRGMPGELFSGAWSQGTAQRSSPSNSIRKAYLSYARLSRVEVGTLLGFYRSQDNHFGLQSRLTAVGIAESYHTVGDYGTAAQLIAKRSVYSDGEIMDMVARPGLRVLNFLFYGYLSEPLSLTELTGMGALRGRPQSFVRVPGEALANLSAVIRGKLVAA